MFYKGLDYFANPWMHFIVSRLDLFDLEYSKPLYVIKLYYKKVSNFSNHQIIQWFIANLFFIILVLFHSKFFSKFFVLVQILIFQKFLA